jgi:hypothetical protein
MIAQEHTTMGPQWFRADRFTSALPSVSFAGKSLSLAYFFAARGPWLCDAFLDTVVSRAEAGQFCAAAGVAPRSLHPAPMLSQADRLSESDSAPTEST